jgi:hypothetical protein
MRALAISILHQRTRDIVKIAEKKETPSFRDYFD